MGDQVEISFRARADSPKGKVAIEIEHAGYPFDKASTDYQITSEWEQYRYVFRNQLPLEDIAIKIMALNSSSVAIEDLNITVQREDVARHYLGKSQGTSHRGGVTFDLISKDLLPAMTVN